MKKYIKSTTVAHELKHLNAVVAPRLKKTGERNFIGSNIGKFAWIHFLEDPIFSSYLFQKLITHFVKEGKRVRVQKLFYRLFSLGAANHKLEFNYAFQLIEKLRPSLIAVPVRFGRNIERVPMPISVSKSYRKAMRYFVLAVRDRRYDKTLEEKIYNEFYDMFFTPGYVNKHCESDFKLALNNSHLKHYRRFGVF